MRRRQHRQRGDGHRLLPGQRLEHAAFSPPRPTAPLPVAEKHRPPRALGDHLEQRIVDAARQHQHRGAIAAE